MNKPLVTVLMPVYNGALYLKDAIDSILSQSYKDFIFMIINDGSIDDSESIILSYNDPRIKYIKNEKNLRLVATLNKGIELIESKYLVRMDADDISNPTRIEELVLFMESNSEVGVCGSACQIFGNHTGLWNFPERHNLILSRLLFESCMPHPATIIRMKPLRENGLKYSEEFIHMEDYVLWHSLKSYVKFHNLNNVLYRYRLSGENITLKNSSTYVERVSKFYEVLLRELGVDYTNRDVMCHFAYGSKEIINEGIYLRDVFLWKEKILKANKLKKIYPETDLEGYMNYKLDKLFYKFVGNNWVYCFEYWRRRKKINFSQIRYVFGQIFRKKNN